MLDPNLQFLLEAIGLSPEHIGYFALACLVANAVSRLIPDDAVGLLGFVRKFAAIVGLHISNRVSSGVSESRAIRSMMDENQEK